MAGARRPLRRVRRLERLLVHVLAAGARVSSAWRTKPPGASQARRERLAMRPARFPRRAPGRLVPAHASLGLAISRALPALETDRRSAGVVDLVLLRSEGVQAQGRCVRPPCGSGKRSKAGEGACAGGVPFGPEQDTE